MKPTIGRIVIYTNRSGEEWPAIITRIHDHDSDLVSLTAFTDAMPNGGIRQASQVLLGDPEQASTWRWPDRV